MRFDFILSTCPNSSHNTVQSTLYAEAARLDMAAALCHYHNNCDSADGVEF